MKENNGWDFPIPPPAPPKPKHSFMQDLHDVYETLNGSYSARCSYCGTRVNSNTNKYCHQCGVKIEWEYFGINK